MKNKKAQQITFGNAPSLVIIFGIVVLIAASMAVGLNGFKQSQCTQTWDGNNCFTNSTLNATGTRTLAANITDDGLTGLTNFSTQVPTIGTILGVALIIVVIVGAFGIFLFSRGRPF